MVDYVRALTALSEAVEVGADDPGRLEAAALQALWAGTRASGAKLSTPRGEVTSGRTDAAQSRHFVLERQGERFGEVELYYEEASPSEAEVCYVELAARVIASALYQVKLVAELRFMAAGLEEQVRERTAQAIRAERMVAVGNLAQGVAVELEGPLTAVHGNLGSILDQIEREAVRLGTGRPMRKFVDDVRDAIGESFLEIDRIARLARDLRRLAPSEAGGKVRVDINLLLQSALNLTRHRFHKKVEVRTDYGTLPELSCYPDRIVSAFANVLVNAAEAVRSTGTIFLRTAREKGQITIDILDSGVGIAEEDLPRVFEPFYTTKRSGDAPGLGLAIVREVVREHGGEVFVESKEGEGTRVELVLPIG